MSCVCAVAVPVERAREADALLLAAAERDTALPNLRLVALRQHVQVALQTRALHHRVVPESETHMHLATSRQDCRCTLEYISLVRAEGILQQFTGWMTAERQGMGQALEFCAQNNEECEASQTRLTYVRRTSSQRGCSP